MNLNCSYTYINNNLFSEDRVFFGPFNSQNDIDCNSKKVGIRAHHWFLGFFLKLIGKAIKVKTIDGRVIYLNKNSLEKWLKRHPENNINHSYIDRIHQVCSSYFKKIAEDPSLPKVNTIKKNIVPYPSSANSTATSSQVTNSSHFATSSRASEATSISPPARILFNSSTTPLIFPNKLRIEIEQMTQKEVLTDSIRRFLEEDLQVSYQFLSWMNGYSEITQHSLLLNQVFTYIRDAVTKISNQESLQRMIWLRPNASMKISQKTPFHLSLDKWLTDPLHSLERCGLIFDRAAFSLLTCYYESGVMNTQQIQHILKLGIDQFAEKDLPLLFPLLEKLPTDLLIEFLIKQNLKGSTFLHTFRKDLRFFSLVNRLSTHQKAELLKSKDKHGNTILHLEPFSDYYQPWLKEVSKEQFYEFLQIQNIEGEIYFHLAIKLDDNDNKAIVQSIRRYIFETLSAEQSLRILKIQNKNGNTIFHLDQNLFYVNFSNLLPENIFELLQIKNAQGNAPLHIEANGYYIGKLMENLLAEQIFQLFSLPNMEGTTFLRLSRYNSTSQELLNKLSSDQILKLLKMQSGTEFGTEYILDTNLQQLVNKFSLEQIFEFLKIPYKTSYRYSYSFFVIKARFFELLNELPSEQVFQALITKNPQEKTIFELMNKSRIEPMYIYPLLYKLSIVQLLQLFGIKQNENRLFCFNDEYLNWLSTVPVSPLTSSGLSVDQFFQLLMLQDIQGTVLRNKDVFSRIKGSIEKLPSHQLLQLLTVRNSQGDHIFNAIGKFEHVLPLFKHLSPDHLFELLNLQIEARSEVTFMHMLKSASLYPLLQTLPVEKMATLLKLKSNSGFTHFRVGNAYEFFADKLTPELFKEVALVEDNNGLSTLILKTKQPSLSWVTKPKITPEDGTIMSPHAYTVRAHRVTQSILQLWSALTFGTKKGQVDPRSFKKTPQEILKAIKVMCGTINTKLVWLGTPKADKPEDVHAFYCEMVCKLETIVEELKEKNNLDLTSGNLARIAIPEIEGRCAAGYKDEIDQVEFVIQLEKGAANTGIKSMVGKILHQALIATISEVTRKSYGADVHYSSQLKYLMGLSLAPDPLVNNPPDELQQAVINEWTLEQMALLCLPRLRCLKKEILSDWFSQNVPLDFNPSTGHLQKQALEFEKEQVRELNNQLRLEGLDEERAQKLVDFCLRPSGSSMRYHIDLSKQLLEMIKSLNEADQALVYAAKDSIDGDIEITATQKIEDIFRKNNLLPDARARSAFRVEISKFVANNRLQLKLVTEFGIDPRIIQKVMEAKSIFDARLRKWMDETEIMFDPKIHGTPSRAIEESRKEIFLQECFNGNGELKGYGMFLLLEHVGAIEPITTR